MTAKPMPPRGLGSAGASLWKSVSAHYELRADELRILEDACREADLVDMLDAALDGDVLTRGSMGQPVVNPVISELRQHRTVLAALMRQLKLPDDGDEVRDSADRSTKARAAANARWARRGA